MKTYEVSLEASAYKTLTINAESQEEAEDHAMNIAEDIDWNCDIDTVEIYSCEEINPNEPLEEKVVRMLERGGVRITVEQLKDAIKYISEEAAKHG